MDIGSKSTRGWATGTDEILQQVGILETDANWWNREGAVPPQTGQGTEWPPDNILSDNRSQPLSECFRGYPSWNLKFLPFDPFFVQTASLRCGTSSPLPLACLDLRVIKHAHCAKLREALSSMYVPNLSQSPNRCSRFFLSNKCRDYRRYYEAKITHNISLWENPRAPQHRSLIAATANGFNSLPPLSARTIAWNSFRYVWINLRVSINYDSPLMFDLFGPNPKGSNNDPEMGSTPCVFFNETTLKVETVGPNKHSSRTDTRISKLNFWFREGQHSHYNRLAAKIYGNPSS